ncbi:MAG: hypothetical protein AB7T17_03700 [Geobacter sp.]|jgi:hypothetical protein
MNTDNTTHGTETQALIDGICAIDAAPAELTEDDKARLELLLAEEMNDYDVACLQLGSINDRLNAGEELSGDMAATGLQSALVVIDAMQTFNNMLLVELSTLNREKQRLAAIAATGPVADMTITGNC